MERRSIPISELTPETRSKLGIKEEPVVDPQLAVLSRILLAVQDMTTKEALQTLRQAIHLVKLGRDRVTKTKRYHSKRTPKVKKQREEHNENSVS